MEYPAFTAAALRNCDRWPIPLRRVPIAVRRRPHRRRVQQGDAVWCPPAMARSLWLGCHCGAQNRQGQPCSVKVEAGKRRCRFHGGLSTGPKTAEGAPVLLRRSGDGIRSDHSGLGDGQESQRHSRERLGVEHERVTKAGRSLAVSARNRFALDSTQGRQRMCGMQA
jgi:hypothetical protein